MSNPPDTGVMAIVLIVENDILYDCAITIDLVIVDPVTLEIICDRIGV